MERSTETRPRRGLVCVFAPAFAWSPTTVGFPRPTSPAKRRRVFAVGGRVGAAPVPAAAVYVCERVHAFPYGASVAADTAAASSATSAATPPAPARGGTR